MVATRKVAYPIDRLFRPRLRFLVRPLAVSLLAGSAILIPSRDSHNFPGRNKFSCVMGRSGTIPEARGANTIAAGERCHCGLPTFVSTSPFIRSTTPSDSSSVSTPILNMSMLRIP